MGGTPRGPRCGMGPASAFAAIVGATALGLAAAPTALADTLSISAGTAQATDSVPVKLTISGETAAAQPIASIYWQRAPAEGCPAEPL